MLRYYPKFSDPILYELKGIPLVKEPFRLSHYNQAITVQYVDENVIYEMKLCDFDEYLDADKNICKTCSEDRYNWDPQGQNCRRCVELEDQWSYNSMVKYLAATACFDVATEQTSGSGSSNTDDDDESESNACWAFCSEGQEWVWPVIILGVTGLVVVIICLATSNVVKAPRRKRRSDEDSVVFLII